MDLKTYQEKASRTCPNLNKQIDPKSQDNLHMILGLFTEIAELADVFKKNLAYGKPIDWINVKEETFDAFWYLVNFCRINDIDMEKGFDINISKLQARYPEKFTETSAINRDLAAEREILETHK